MTEGEYPNLIVIGYTPSHQLIRTVFKQIWVIKIVFYLHQKFPLLLRSIGMEFVMSLDNLLYPHTMASGQEQKVTHRGKCRLWADLQKLSPKLSEKGG